MFVQSEERAPWHCRSGKVTEIAYVAYVNQEGPKENHWSREFQTQKDFLRLNLCLNPKRKHEGRGCLGELGVMLPTRALPPHPGLGAPPGSQKHLRTKTTDSKSPPFMNHTIEAQRNMTSLRSQSEAGGRVKPPPSSPLPLHFPAPHWRL